MPEAFSVSVWNAPSPLSFAHPLKSGEQVDLVVVGGGFQGLSTALHAAELGLRVRVLEAARIGEGASGLNGGQVIPGLKYDPEWLLSHFGASVGERLITFAASTADAVFNLIDRHKLDVPRQRRGWIQAAHTEKARALQFERQRQWAKFGADTALLDAKEISEMTGARGYVGGWLDRRAGVIDPLALVRELARVASESGVLIGENACVKTLRQGAGAWRVETENGHVIRARSVLVATNAYSDGLVPGLRESLVPLNSFQIATEPLPPGLQEHILPGGQAVSDSRRIFIYYRKTADGRLAMGGRGRQGGPRTADDWRHIERAMLRVFPALERTPITHRWHGRVCVTPDHLPHIHEPEAGLLAVSGCQGRGVGLMMAIGSSLARYIADGDHRHLPLPITSLRPIPFHVLRNLVVSATIAWYRLLDGFDV